MYPLYVMLSIHYRQSGSFLVRSHVVKGGGTERCDPTKTDYTQKQGEKGNKYIYNYMSKVPKSDGNLDLVDQSILLAARDQQKWVEERRKNWPTRERIAKRQAEEKLNPPAPKRTPGTQPTDGGTAPSGNNGGGAAPKGPKTILCRYFLRGRCNAGPRCRFSHDISKKDQEERAPAPPSENRIYKRYEAPVKSSLFVKLVQTDHDAEDDRFLDFVAYLKGIKALD